VEKRDANWILIEMTIMIEKSDSN